MMVKITYLGHASFLLEYDGVKVVFDPYQDHSVTGLVFPKDLEADFVFTSHEHRDHNAKEYVKINEQSSPFLNIDAEEFICHHDTQNGELRGENSAKLISFNGISFCHLGDLGDINTPNLLNFLKKADYIFIPINGFYTISATDAFYLKKELKHATFIPMHYYMDDKKCGYEDNKQIETFKYFFQNHLKVNTYTLEITNKDSDYDAIIFTEIYQ